MRQNKHVKWFKWLLAIVIVTSLLLTYSKHYNHPPLGVHNWAQSDRYSVAKMFQENSNFFTPQTHNLSSENGRCGVEFPILQYTSAHLSNLFNQDSLPFIYKLLNLLVLLWGSWFFLRKWNDKSGLGILIGLNLLFSPILVFYGFNYLPDTAAISVLLFSFGCLIKYDQTNSFKPLILAIGLAALAALIKTTCGIYFIALTGSIGLYYLLNKDWKKLGIITTWTLAWIVVIALYDFYLFHEVNRTLWSPIFMSQSQPIENLADLRSFWKALRFWHGQYLTWPATILLISLLGFGAAQRRKKRVGIVSTTLLVSFVGLLAFVKLMGKQFVNHDYYFISAFIPFLCLLGYYLFKRIQNHSISGRPIVLIAVIGLLAWNMVLSLGSYSPRMKSHFVWKKRDIINDVEWLQNGDQILDDLGMPDDAKLFIGYAAAPNTSLVYFNRKGKVFNHEEMTRDSANMDYWSNRIQPDYYIFPTAWQSHLEKDQPKLYSNLVLFAKRPAFHIYKPLK